MKSLIYVVCHLNLLWASAAVPPTTLWTVTDETVAVSTELLVFREKHKYVWEWKVAGLNSKTDCTKKSMPTFKKSGWSVLQIQIGFIVPQGEISLATQNNIGKNNSSNKIAQ